MRVFFKGSVELPYADDRGSYDIWLLKAIKQAIENGPETDDIYEALSLHWDETMPDSLGG